MRLATDLTDGSAVPYFLWDEPLTMDELRRRLAGGDDEERVRLAAKVMREARFDEAVRLVPVAEIVPDYPRLRPNLGRRLAFWDFLIGEWRSLGLIPWPAEPLAGADPRSGREAFAWDVPQRRHPRSGPFTLETGALRISTPSRASGGTRAFRQCRDAGVRFVNRQQS